MLAIYARNEDQLFAIQTPNKKVLTFDPFSLDGTNLLQVKLALLVFHQAKVVDGTWYFF